MVSTVANQTMLKTELHKNSDNECASNLIKFIYVLAMSFGGLGEWRVITSALGGKPKALTITVIAVTFFYCLIKGKSSNLKKVYKTYFMYVMMIALILVWSFVIWILNFADPSSITRGGEKMLYQFISITVAASSVVLFGLESINMFFISMCISNFLIMAFEMIRFGIASSIQSFFHNIFTFGDAVGFARNIEIHELTFLFGMFLIYYLAFAPSNTKTEKRKKYIYLALAFFFFIAGVKRIAVFSLAITLLLILAIRKNKNLSKIIIGIGVFFFVFYFFYLKVVRDGSFSELMSKLGIDMMGRNYIWSLTNSYYRLSPTYMGLGFEAVDRISKEWYDAGLVQAAFMFHNDILKVFVELGFPGFTVWSLVQYVVYPVYFNKKFGTEVALCYIALLFYMSFTYMTDNTAFYFWCTMGLRMIPLAYSFTVKATRKKPPKWTPMLKDEYKNKVAVLLNKSLYE